MPKRTELKSILIIGAGPIIIGQACEFDYSGTQAVKALKEEGYRIVLVNSNPATIMTDPDLADATYVEPITPEIVAGASALLLFTQIGLQLSLTTIILAHITFSISYVTVVVRARLAALGRQVEDASMDLGATRWQTFWRVILPTLAPAMLAGCSQAFIRSLGEFGAVVMIAGNIPFQTEVTSLMIFVRLQEFNYPAAAAIASVVLLASLLLLFTLQVAQVRLMGWQRSR